MTASDLGNWACRRPAACNIYPEIPLLPPWKPQSGPFISAFAPLPGGNSLGKAPLLQNPSSQQRELAWVAPSPPLWPRCRCFPGSLPGPWDPPDCLLGVLGEDPALGAPAPFSPTQWHLLMASKVQAIVEMATHSQIHPQPCILFVCCPVLKNPDPAG